MKMIKNCTSPDVLLAKAFRRYGRLVAQNYIVFIVVPGVIACLLGSGLLLKDRNKQLDVDYLYAPTISRYKDEQNMLYNLWPIDPDHYTPWSIANTRQMTQTLLYVRDDIEDTNMLDLVNIKLANDFNDYIMNDLTVVAQIPQFSNHSHVMVTKNVTFRDICMRFKKICSYSNEHLMTMYNRIQFKGNPEFDNQPQLTYPKAKFGEKSISLASGVGGVQTNVNGIMTYVKTIGVIYHIRHDALYASATAKWEQAYLSFMDQYNNNVDNRLNGAYTISTTINKGLEQNTEALKPRFTITFGTIIVFVIICSFKLTHVVGETPRLDMVRSKPILAIVGVITAALGIASAEGLLIFAEYDFSDVAEIMPFLVLSIGVDDMFILTAAWRATDASKSVEDRVSDSLSEAAVSITITSITNAISFAVGISTPIRAVQIFCAYTALAIVMNYILQITFFVGFMTMSGKWEAEGRNSIWPCSKITTDNCVIQPEGQDPMHKFVESYYGPLLVTTSVRIITSIVIGFYLLLAIWGSFYLKEGLKHENLMLNDYHGAVFFRYYRANFVSMGLQAEVLVQNVPDLSNPTNRKMMELIVNSFEALPFTMDNRSTEFWMRDYLEGYPTPKNKIKDWTWRLNRWSNLASIEKTYSQAFKWRNTTNKEIEQGCQCEETGVVEAFRFKIGFKDFTSTNNQKQAVIYMRSVADQFKQFKVSSYMGEYPFLDQYLIILPTTFKNIGIAIACMIIVALILIPYPICIVWIVLTIVSIDVGVVGCMTWWGVSLDSISMITMIMSIGFSVDYSAHITYGFMSARGTSSERLVQSITHLGLPVLQGAISTILGVVVLSTTNSYMLQTFFKTVFLVILFGVIHACLFLPVMLGITYDITIHCKTKAKKFNSFDLPTGTPVPEHVIIPTELHTEEQYAQYDNRVFDNCSAMVDRTRTTTAIHDQQFIPQVTTIEVNVTDPDQPCTSENKDKDNVV